MKKILFIFGILTIFSTFAFGQTAKSEKEVQVVLKKWADAVVKRDAVALGKILSDDLIVTTFDGVTRGKKEELAILKPNPNVTTHSVENKEVRIKVYGNTAVVTATTETLFIISEKTASSSLRYTAVLVKQKGIWQIVALQTARITPSSKK